MVFEVASPGGTPTGTVRVTASGGSETCSADVSVGRCTITLNADGNRTLTASFQGGTLFESSSDTESHQVITPDQPPTAQNDNYGATAGVPLTVGAGQGVLANDSDPDGDSMTASLVSGPSSGTLDLQQRWVVRLHPIRVLLREHFLHLPGQRRWTDRHGYRHHHRDLIGVRSWKRNPLQC